MVVLMGTLKGSTMSQLLVENKLVFICVNSISDAFVATIIQIRFIIAIARSKDGENLGVL